MALNFNVLKSPAGYLKLIHVQPQRNQEAGNTQKVLGAAALGIVVYYSSGSKAVALANENFYFHLVTFAFLTTSFILLVSILYDESIRKSHFEIIYHSFAFIFYISASIALIAYVSKWNSRSEMYTMHIVASVLGLVNSLAYGGNAFLAYKSR